MNIKYNDIVLCRFEIQTGTVNWDIMYWRRKQLVILAV